MLSEHVKQLDITLKSKTSHRRDRTFQNSSFSSVTPGCSHVKLQKSIVKNENVLLTAGQLHKNSFPLHEVGMDIELSALTNYRCGWTHPPFLI